MSKGYAFSLIRTLLSRTKFAARCTLINPALRTRTGELAPGYFNCSFPPTKNNCNMLLTLEMLPGQTLQCSVIGLSLSS